ncbi:hypothetical protein [Spirulina sp. 06S082]|uniref:hypothetical protein n=1 Tax=Spirulina sp. 06S082 TaxID=3110248 RepID=UPI002B2146C9|nr:hypothetical protein [Spirulina sp. 06S082]MEA5470218.1 hypothetical protein [Spirulina sp. 06S082]
MKGCQIYFNKKAIYLICQSRTVFGIWIACEPVFTLNSETKSHELGIKVLEILEFSKDQIPHDSDRLIVLPKSALKATGFKSWKMIEKNSSLVFVTSNDIEVEITPYVVSEDKQGFEPLIKKVLKCNIEANKIGELLLDLQTIY